MKLEDFIIANSDKSLFGGGAFVYESVTVHLRLVGSGIFELTMVYPAPEFRYSDCFDIRKLNRDDGDLIALYNWMQDTFLPGAIKAFSELKCYDEHS